MYVVPFFRVAQLTTQKRGFDSVKAALAHALQDVRDIILLFFGPYIQFNGIQYVIVMVTFAQIDILWAYTVAWASG